MAPSMPTTDSFGPAAVAVMQARQVGVRCLARAAGVSAGHMSRVLREVDGKRPSRDLIERVAEILELPEGYFLEQRRSRIVSLLEADPGLIDRLEAVVPRAEPGPNCSGPNESGYGVRVPASGGMRQSGARQRSGEPVA